MWPISGRVETPLRRVRDQRPSLRELARCLDLACARVSPSSPLSFPVPILLCCALVILGRLIIIITFILHSLIGASSPTRSFPSCHGCPAVRSARLSFVPAPAAAAAAAVAASFFPCNLFERSPLLAQPRFPQPPAQTKLLPPPTLAVVLYGSPFGRVPVPTFTRSAPPLPLSSPPSL